MRDQQRNLQSQLDHKHNTGNNHIGLTEKTNNGIRQTIIPQRKIRLTRRTSKTHLETEGQQGKLQDKLVYHPFSKRVQLLQYFQTMKP